MTAKKTPITPDENKKIWGWIDQDGNFKNDMTRAQAEKSALEEKKNYPDDEITIFKVVATVENQPYIKGV